MTHLVDPLASPFLEARHEELRARIRAEVAPGIRTVLEDFRAARLDEASAARAFVEVLGGGGLLEVAVHGDVRSLCVAREEIASVSGFADTQLALQGLGSDPIRHSGSRDLLSRYVETAARGAAIPAFALTEPEAGSDARSLTTRARRDGDVYRLNGVKTLITNAGVADYYCVFARLDVPARKDEDAPTVALVVDADSAGVRLVERLQTLGPHPIGTVAFENCAVPADQRVGEEGKGLSIAFRTLQRFRPSVGAAAAGLASRALGESLHHVMRRVQFGRALASFQMIKERLADMHADLETARLHVYRAAWSHDQQGSGRDRETMASMAKLVATEAAGRIADLAVQLLGGRGVLAGETVELIYREVRALRIYEGSSEIQKLILARELVARS